MGAGNFGAPGGASDGFGAGGFGAPPGGVPDGGMGGFGAPPGGAPFGAPPGPNDFGAPPAGFGAPAGAMQPYGGAGMAPIGGMAPMAMTAAPGEKSWMVTLLLALFAGGLGAHRFYTGHMLYGVLQLVTCGGFGIWTLIDIIFILTDKYTDAQGRRLVK